MPLRKRRWYGIHSALSVCLCGGVNSERSDSCRHESYREGKDNKASAIIMSFPGIVDGKPLISHRDEKLEIRFIVNQRVFETTFIVNSTDLFDGTETVMHAPTRVDEPTPAVLP